MKTYVMLGLLLLAVLIFICFRVQTSIQLKNKVRELQANGYPATLEELDKWYPEVPEGKENAADYYSKAEKAYVDPEKAGIDSKSLLVIGTREAPPLSISLSSEQKSLSQRFLEKNKETMRLLGKAISVEHCRFPVDLKKGYLTMLPHLSNIRESSRLFALQALVSSEEGDSAACMQNIKNSFLTAKSLDMEPTLISNLIQIVCYSTALNAFERAISRSSFKDADLQEFFWIIRDNFNEEGLKRAIIGEQATCLGTDWAKDFTKVYNFVTGEEPKKSGSMSMTAMTLFFGLTGGWDKAKIKYIDRIKTIINPLTLNKSYPEIEKTLNNILQNKDILSGMLLPSACGAVKKGLNMDAEIKTALTVIAVEQYRNKYNSLPKTLEKLVPEFLDLVPLDPYNLEPLKYRVGEIRIEFEENHEISGYKTLQEKLEDKTIYYILKDGYVVYSVGPDMDDDNGLSLSSNLKTSKLTEALRRKDGDVAFRVVNKRREK